MQYRRLGNAGIKLSEIGLGGWLTFGNAMEKQTAAAVMSAAFDTGINFFDTADAYAGGACEAAWGELLAEHRRAEFVLATKCFFPTGPGPNDRGLSRKHIHESIDASLKRLKTDYVDLYQCHRFDADTPLDETVRAMDDLIRRGKILYWGVSEWSAEQIQQCLQIAGDRFDRLKSNQPRYSLLERQWERDVFPLCHTAGMGQVVFSPLAQGVLTGKYQPGKAPPADSRAADDRQNQFIKRFTDKPDVLTSVLRLKTIADRRGCTLAQLCLAWALRRPEITSCIIGASRPAQLVENAVASGMKLTDAEIGQMEEIVDASV